MQFLSDFNPEGLRILVRLDLDLPVDAAGQFDTTRMEDGFATLSYLREHGAAHVTVIAHRGHHVDLAKQAEFSLKPIADLLYIKLLKRKAFQETSDEQLREWLEIRENLRFDPREEAGDLEFAKDLAADQDAFVNDAFATSHRAHTSIVFLPQVLPAYFGLQMEKELKVMKKVTESPDHPVVFILGGSKLDTKMGLIEKVSQYVDVVLLGGKLALEAAQTGFQNPKVMIASLTPDGFDIDAAAVAQFTAKIAEAKTIIWNGPMGKFEDGEHAAGTKAIAEAVAASRAFTVIGGGDTEAALTQLGVDETKFNHISSGGGAMLEYLSEKTLAALKQ